jgi:large conductance mechanosensitive channel
MKIPMSDLLKEFKAFAFKGNMIDLAVAVVIGTAFGAVVNSLVKNIFMPLLAFVIPGKEGYRTWAPGGIEIGAFIGEVINFLAIAAAVFLFVVKLMGTLVRKAVPPPATGMPVAKECPRCISEIPIRATRCKFCTSDLAVKA